MIFERCDILNHWKFYEDFAELLIFEIAASCEGENLIRTVTKLMRPV